MKKLLLFIAAMILCIVAMAQNDRGPTDSKTFIGITAGPSFPIGDYGSTGEDNENAGMARTGYNITLQFGHRLGTTVGLGASAFYTQHKVDNPFDNMGGEGTVTVKDWSYYGLTVGPLLTMNVAPKAFMDFSVQAGLAEARSPKISVSYGGETVGVNSDKAWTVPVKLDANLRFALGARAQLLAGVNYLYMRPEFKVEAMGYSETAKQSMSALGVNLGVGLGF